ncbi:MAG: septum formation initiator family protein [Rhodothermia bacterium]
MSIFQRLGLSDKTPRRLALAGGILVLLWVLFLDSHSILNRVIWSREASSTEVRNEELQAEIEYLRVEIEHAGDPEAVERVARESYGMRKDGETVYRVEEATD